jgi:hypothetical protein
VRDVRGWDLVGLPERRARRGGGMMSLTAYLERAARRTPIDALHERVARS